MTISKFAAANSIPFDSDLQFATDCYLLIRVARFGELKIPSYHTFSFPSRGDHYSLLPSANMVPTANQII